MSRTVGAKDKQPRKKPVRKIKMTSAQVNMAAKLGVPLETYAKELVKARKPRKKTVRKPKYVEPTTIPRLEEDSGYVYRWIRADLFKDGNKRKLIDRNGWTPVKAEEQPSLQPMSSRKTTIQIGGLVLCKMKKTDAPINWEKLAKELQTALRDEIVENQKRATDIDALLFKIKSLEHQVIGFQAVISYLETKSGNDTV